MHNSRFRRPGFQGGASPPPAPLGELRLHETRIREYQNLPVSPEALPDKLALLKREAQASLSTVRAYAADGAFRYAEAAELAHFASSYARIRRFPVAEEIDAIMGFVEQEVRLRASAQPGAAGTDLSLWPPRFLARITHALSQCAGPGILMAIDGLAQTLVETGPLRVATGWTAEPLAMMADGLSRRESALVRQALERLAQAIASRDLALEPDWTARHLSMVINGLCRGSGPATQQALRCLAQQVNNPALSRPRDWAARDLAMTVSGLGMGQGKDVQAAQVTLAQTLQERNLNARYGWTDRDLIMLANGLGWSQGPEVGGALIHLGEEVMRRPLAQESGWTLQALAVMAQALGRAQETGAALSHLARALRGRHLVTEAGWTPQDLAMLAQGLGQGEGEDIKEALAHLARQVAELELTPGCGWTALDLAMMAKGLSRGRGGQIEEALSRLARAVGHGERRVEQGWTAHALAMMASGLSRGESTAIRGVLRRLADSISEQPLTCERGWTGPRLAMMIDALGQTMPGHPVFQNLAQALVTRAALEPETLACVLMALCSFSLSRCHRAVAQQLLAALDRLAFVPRDRRTREGLLWCTTLLHFACQKPVDPDPTRAQAFAHYHSYYRACPAGDSACEPDPPTPDDHWHAQWIHDYWFGPSGTTEGPPDRLVQTGSASVTSFARQQVFEHFQRALPGRVLQRAARVHQFPVDILIDGRVCIEIDGPGHCVLLEAGDGDRAGSLREERLTRDQFVDHMLGRYGYRVFRVREGLDADRLYTLAAMIRSGLDGLSGHNARSRRGAMRKRAGWRRQ